MDRKNYAAGMARAPSSPERSLALRYVRAPRPIVFPTTPCVPLKLFWVVAPIDGLAVALRLARDADKAEILLSELETARAVAATARAESEALRGQVEAARREAKTARSGKR